MPVTFETILNDNQQKIITDIIDDNFSLEDLSNFDAFVENLKSAFYEKRSSIENINLLVNLVLTPHKYFFRLQHVGAAVSFADVQNFVINYIREKLEKIKPLDWPIETMQALIEDGNDKINFESQYIPPAPANLINAHPEEYVNQPEKIYTLINVCIDQIRAHVEFSMILDLPTLEAREAEREICSANLSQEANASIEAIHMACTLRADQHALKAICEYLELSFIDIKVITDIELEPRLISLLSDRTYIALLKAKEIGIIDIYRLSEQAFLNLSSSSLIKDLIKENYLSISQAKNLTEPQRRLLANRQYNALFRKGVFGLKETQKYLVERVHLLAQPAIYRLINLGYLPFQKAISLSFALPELLKVNFYYKYFFGDPSSTEPKSLIDWSLFQKIDIDDLELLTDQRIIDLFKNKILSFEQFFELIPTKRKELLHENIYPFISSQKLSINDYADYKFFRVILLIKEGKLFANNFYRGLFLGTEEQKVDWAKLANLTSNEVNLLLQPEIMMLFEKKILSFEQFSQLTSLKKQGLTNKENFVALLANELSLETYADTSNGFPIERASSPNPFTYFQARNLRASGTPPLSRRSLQNSAS